MSNPQRTFDDFAPPISSGNDPKKVESRNIGNSTNDTDEDGLKSPPEASCEKKEGDEGSVRSESPLQTKSTSDTDSELRFGKDPEEFDIPCKWACRYLGHRCADSLQSKSLSESSLPGYESTLREYVNYLHAHDQTVLDADYDTFENFILYCVEIGRRTATIMGRVSTIRGLYKHIKLKEDVDAEISPLEFDQIERSAVADLTPSDIEREDLTRDELEKLFEAIPEERGRLMAIVGTETGFRNSDIRCIRLRDIDFDAPEIYAHDPKYSKPYTVPISEELALELEIWIETGREAKYGHIDSEYLFPSERGPQIESGTNLTRIIRDAAKDAGIQGILGTSQYESEYLKQPKVDRTWHQVIPHVLRHSFITILEKEGVSLEYRRLLANHSSAETTRNYSHGKKEVLKEAQRRVDLHY